MWCGGMLTENDKKAVREFLRRVRELYDVADYRIFGSKSRGDDQEPPDIDILVLLEKKPLTWSDASKVSEVSTDVSLEYDVLLSPLVLNVDEWKHGLYTVLPFHKTVERDGVRI